MNQLFKSTKIKRSPLFLMLFCMLLFTESALAVTRTWDGGGATNNWSEAANWSDNSVPTSVDDVVFNGTSTKNAVIDVNVTVATFSINAGYTGTISQGASNLTVSGAYTQAAGIFTAGSGTITIGSTNIQSTQSGGTFTGSSGTLDFNGFYTVSGGSFTASSGNTHFAQQFTVSGTGGFEPNGGTVVFDSQFDGTLDVLTIEEFNNVQINKSSDTAALTIASGDILRVNGTLTLINGQLAGAGILEALGDISIASTFDGGSGNLSVLGNATRTVSIPAPVSMPNVIVNAPNTTIDTSGAGTISFQSFNLQNLNLITNGAVNFNISGSFTQSGSTFNAGSGAVTVGTAFTLSAGIFTAGSGTITFGSTNIQSTQSGGTFTGGSGTLDFNGFFTVSGGSFTASSGNTHFAQQFTVSGTGGFEPNGGTVVFDSQFDGTLDVLTIEEFNNVQINKSSDTASLTMASGDTLRVNGTLTLINGQLAGAGILEALGDISIASTFDGGSGNLSVLGNAARTVSIPAPLSMPNVIVNAPNTAIDTSGAGTISFQSFNLQNLNLITNGAVNFNISGSFTQSGSTFNAGSGLLDFNGAFTVSGGSFTSSSGTASFAANFTVSGAGVFDPNGGTVVFDGAALNSQISVPASFTLANLTVNKTGTAGVFFDTTSTIVVTGALTLTDGLVSNLGGTGTIEAQGAVSMAPTYDGGTANHLISGAATRTVTLPVGAGIPRLTLNAPNVTVNTSGAGTITFTQALDIQSSALFTNGAVNFVFSNPFTFAAGSNFTPGSGNLTFNGAFTQTGGTFTAGSGELNFNQAFTVSGGTFNAPVGTVTFAASFTISNPAVFNHNGGTVVFVGAALNSQISVPASFTLANLTVNKTGTAGVFFDTTSTIVVTGALTLTDGLVSNLGGTGTIEAQGVVSIAPTYDGGTANFRFSGAANQTFTNAGGLNLTGIWTLDKSAGTVTLISDLNLSNGASSFNLTNGTITTGANTVIAGTRTITRTNGFVNGNLRQTYTSAGSRQFDVGTAGGYAPVTINATAGTFPATFTVGGNDGTLAGASPTQSITRNWSLTPGTGGIVTANIRFDYQQADVPVGAIESNFTFLRRTGGTTSNQGITSLDTTNNFATLDGVTQFSDWSLGNLAVTAANVMIGGRVLTDTGHGISRARLSLTDQFGNIRQAVTSSFGYYRFDNVEVGQSYVVSVAGKGYQFANPSQVVFVTDKLTDFNFIALNQIAANGLAEIGGRILDAKGNGLIGVEVELTGGDMEKARVILSDKTGNYLFENIKVGQTYILNVNHKQLIFETKIVFLEEEITDLNFQAIP